MTEHADRAGPGFSWWRVVGWGLAALLLLLPLVAMQFTPEVNWTLGDFIFAAFLFGLVGVTAELTVRATADWWYRAGAFLALAAAFLIIWVNGAVGMIGDEGNDYNLLFLGVIVLALVGAVIGRFRAMGLAYSMAASAAAHLAVGLFGMTIDPLGGLFSAGFSIFWMLSAALFWRSGRGPRAG